LSFRDVEDLLAERGIMVSYETVRRWVNHFGGVVTFWVLLVNSAGRSRSACLYINTLGRLSKCQIGSKIPILGQCDVAIMRTAQKGIVHPNTAARKSRGYAD
jgi:ribosomal protein S20